ncbi:MAG: glutaredoxin family protein, partial [Anaerolineae bacterium]|nr:glutaredoxin family protein [Anaerolineae bacterium]
MKRVPDYKPDHNHELVMYTRTAGCPFVTTAKRVLADFGVPYREVFIDQDPEARARVLAWTGFLSVPTLVVAAPGQDVPWTAVAPLPPGDSPRGVDRGPMLTEASSL